MKFTKSVQLWLQRGRNRIPYRPTVRLIQKYPFIAFFIALGILLALIITSNVLYNFNQKVTPQPEAIKSVQVYKIGSSPKVTLQARIEKSGVIKVTAQTGAIVQRVLVTEGQTIYRGTQLFSLSSNYQGGSAFDLQASIAQKQNQLTEDTYQEQKDLIGKQRDLANNVQSNNDKLRDLSAQSATESSSLISKNQDILNSINDQLSTYQNNQSNNVPTPTGSASYDQLILQTKQLQAQYQGTINQLSSQQRQLSYSGDSNQPGSAMQQNQKDITLKQLEIQDKTLDINKEISNLQLQLAYVNASMMHPASPCDGVVDSIQATFGTSVIPGTILASISCNSQSVKTIVQVPAALASTVSLVEPSVIHLDNQVITETPDYVSRDATDGQLYSVIYHIPENIERYITDGVYITADVPIGLPNTSPTDPYIPLDAIYQTQSTAYLYKIVAGKAKSQEINLGNVYGRFVAVDTGLKDGDEVVLNRDIFDGEKVKVSK